MKVQMWCDMEGVGGIVSWEQVSGGKVQYEEGRLLYTNEINAAVRGAKKAGATEIVVIDGHGAGGGHSMNSWRKDLLEPGAEYIMGYRWGCYVQAFKTGCDALLLPGAHAMAGTPDGVLSHTMSSHSWYNALFNGVKVGESGIVAAIAGSFGVPCVWASGDAATMREVAGLIGPEIHQCVVKEGLGRYSARSLSHADACAKIERTVEEALKNRAGWPKPYRVPAPVEFRVEMATSDQAEEHRGKTGVEVLADHRTIVSRGETAWQCWDQFYPRK
jgi:D-amino peptidase